MKTYTWRDYWKSYKGMSLLFIDNTYAELYPWWNLKRYKVRGRLWEMWYYFKCWAWKRYSTVTPRFVPPTWIDRSELLLHTSFEILLDYVENEHRDHWTVEELEKELAKPVESYSDVMSRGWCEHYLPVAKEIEFLYQWWTVDRPAREAEYERRLTAWSELRGSLGEVEPDTDEYSKAESALREMDDRIRDEQDNEMLRRLIAVRGYLWT